MRAPCHSVPWHLVLAVALGLPLGGCFLFHGGDGCSETVIDFCCDPAGFEVTPLSRCPTRCPAGSTRSDAICPRPSFPDASVPDASGPVADAGAPSLCAPVDGVSTCRDPWVAPAGEPFTLPVTLDACGCCPDTQCDVQLGDVEGRPALRVSTRICPDPCDCDGCFPAQAQCEVPSLGPGTYEVVVNGSPSFALEAQVSAPGLVPPPPGCATFAEPDRCQISETLDDHALQPSRVCVAAAPPVAGGGTSLRVEADCTACGELLGPCYAHIEPRLTDDLPPGGEIFLTTRAHWTDCDVDCGPRCRVATLDCALPPLVDGDVYRVFHDGVAVGTFTAGDGRAPCFETPAPPGP